MALEPVSKPVFHWLSSLSCCRLTASFMEQLTIYSYPGFNLGSSSTLGAAFLLLAKPRDFASRNITTNAIGYN
jgi:hypothetical protein